LANSNHFRYFIVLQPEKNASGAMTLQRQSRRQAAFDFIKLLKEWVAENRQQEMVSAIDVTMFGQIQIICDPTLIKQIREQDVLAIAEIRPAKGLDINLRRLFDQASG
jgi:hypothetical protein